jgi:ubiquinol-cytochrome c reductase iron-sulfur subunit
MTIAVSFALSAIASVALCIVYLFGGQSQLEGALLGVALGGIAVGLIAWGKSLMPSGPFVEQRDLSPASEEREFQAARESFEEGATRFQRRSFLIKTLAGAVTALGVAALFPIRSLGTRPGRSLFNTPWSDGVRLVNSDNEPVGEEDLAINGILTVFPENYTDAADAQCVLIRLEPGLYQPLQGREDWSPEGFVAFSKVCTHAGCPVGLYQADSQELFCPCHQSVFAVLEGAAPIGGPATRPLPQLPLAIENGFFVATGDFPEPAGVGFWDRPRG